MINKYDFFCDKYKLFNNNLFEENRNNPVHTLCLFETESAQDLFLQFNENMTRSVHYFDITELILILFVDTMRLSTGHTKSMMYLDGSHKSRFAL